MKRLSLAALLISVVCALSMSAVAFADTALTGGDADDLGIGVQANPAVTVTYADGHTATFNDNGATSSIQMALEEANSASNKGITVTLEKNGKYTLTDVWGTGLGKLRIYSNTTLDLNGATITRPDSVINDGMIYNYPVGWDGKNVKRADVGGYDMSTNITVKNGTLDGGDTSKCAKDGASDLLRIDHASNIVIDNVTMKNVYDCHHLEFVGVKNGKVTNCKFSGFKYMKGKEKNTEYGREAIEIDAAWKTSDKELWAKDTMLDMTADQDCVFDNCTFDEVPSAVGGHHWSNDAGYKNSKNITISNCTITGSKSYYKTAITAGGMDNLTVTGNKVSGPYVYSVHAYRASGITISNNELDNSSSNAILVDENASGVTISGNTVVDSKRHAISVLNSGIDVISGNTITGGSNNGINVSTDGASVGSIDNNTIKKAGVHAISIVGGTVGSVTANKITSPTKNGINMAKDTSGTKPSVKNVTSNTIKSAKVNAISVVGAKVTNITKNKVEKTAKKGSGISVTSGSVKLIGQNKVNNAGKNAITVVGGTVGKKGNAKTGIIGNTVKKTQAGMGITVSKKGTAYYINKNTITNPAKNAIAFTGKVTVNQVKSNKITVKKTSFGIWAGGTKVKTNVTKNTITCAAKKYGFGHATGAKYKSSANKITVKK